MRSAEEALREGERVELEPMSAAERRLVHERLKDYEGVSTGARGTSRIATSSSSPLDDWLRAVVATPGLTALDLDARAARPARGLAARGRAAWARSRGRSSTWAPAAARPGSRSRTRCRSTRSCCSRRSAGSASSSSSGRRRTRASSGAGPRSRRRTGPASRVAKALAPPPVAAEWCLPLVREGGAVVLWVGETAEPERVARVAERLAAEPADAPAGPARAPQARPDAARLPAPDRRRPQAPARLSRRDHAAKRHVPNGHGRSRSAPPPFRRAGPLPPPSAVDAIEGWRSTGPKSVPTS